MKKVLSVLALVVVLGGCGAAEEADSPAANVAPAITADTCFNDTVFYEVGGTSMKFCYSPEWGEPVVSDPIPGDTGKKFSISFSSDSTDSPVIEYFSDDYSKGDTDVPIFDFFGISPYMSEPEISSKIAEYMDLSDEDFSSSKVSVNGVRGIRVHYDYDGYDKLFYYVYNAFDGYDLQISGPNSIAVDIDDMAQLMISF